MSPTLDQVLAALPADRPLSRIELVQQLGDRHRDLDRLLGAMQADGLVEVLGAGQHVQITPVGIARRDGS